MTVEFRSGAIDMRNYFEALPGSALDRNINNYFHALKASGQFRWLGVFEVMERAGRTSVVFCQLESRRHTPESDDLVVARTFALASMASHVGSNVTIQQRVYNSDVTPYGVACYLQEVMSKHKDFKSARLLWKGDI